MSSNLPDDFRWSDFDRYNGDDDPPEDESDLKKRHKVSAEAEDVELQKFKAQIVIAPEGKASTIYASTVVLEAANDKEALLKFINMIKLGAIEIKGGI